MVVPDTAPLPLRLLAVVFLVAANAFFVAAEFAIVSVRPTRLRQLEKDGHSGARTALRVHGHLDRVLSATQLGITLASLGLGWIGEHAVSDLVLPLFSAFAEGPRLAIAHSIAIGIAFLIITALHLVLGEVVPKNVALGRANDRLVLLIARPMEVFMQVTHPFLRVMDAAAAGISKLFGAETASHRHIHSPEELKMLVAAGLESGIVDEQLDRAVQGLFDLGNIRVREVMVPRPDIVSVSLDASIDQIVQTFAESQHSRLPVYEGSPDNFIGVLFLKDIIGAGLHRQLAPFAVRPGRPLRVRSLLRTVPIVPETKPLNQLLDEFRDRRRHLALVVDEFGTIAGLVTVVDILQRIFGSFSEQTAIEEVRAGPSDVGLLLEGSLHIRDLEERYEIRLPRDGGFETLAGFVMTRLGRIPRPGDTVTEDAWRFTVEEMDRHRIALVRLDPLAPGAVASNQ